MTTTRDLIRQALSSISVIGAGENMTAEDANDTLRLLNQMLSSWSADGAVIFNRSVDTKVLSAGVSTYTMGPSGDINTTRPVGISQATITLSQIVTPVNIWSQNTYSVLSFPTLQGPVPTDMFVNNGVPLLTLQLYPVPSSATTLTIYSMKPLDTLTLDTTLALPPGYEAALWSNLAIYAAPFYEREATKSIREIASTTLSTVKANNLQYNQAPMMADLAWDVRFTNNGNTWGYNIYGGQ